MKILNDIEIHAAISEVLRRAGTDEEFRSRAVKDGMAAIQTVSSKSLPPGIRVQFVDNSGPVKTIPLPDLVSASDTLTDMELNQVAGGCDIASCMFTT